MKEIEVTNIINVSTNISRIKKVYKMMPFDSFVFLSFIIDDSLCVSYDGNSIMIDIKITRAFYIFEEIRHILGF